MNLSPVDVSQPVSNCHFEPENVHHDLFNQTACARVILIPDTDFLIRQMIADATKEWTVCQLHMQYNKQKSNSKRDETMLDQKGRR
jgi:hypothetical protein